MQSVWDCKEFVSTSVGLNVFYSWAPESVRKVIGRPLDSIRAQAGAAGMTNHGVSVSGVWVMGEPDLQGGMVGGEWIQSWDPNPWELWHWSSAGLPGWWAQGREGKCYLQSLETLLATWVSSCGGCGLYFFYPTTVRASIALSWVRWVTLDNDKRDGGYQKPPVCRYLVRDAGDLAGASSSARWASEASVVLAEQCWALNLWGLC